jgi:sugar phosphate isomerase/epimerase
MTVAAQAYTFRERMAADPAAALARLRETGYSYVELAGLHGRSAAEIRRWLDAAGVTAVSAHVPWPRLAGETDVVLEELATLGIEHAVVPSLPGERREQGAEGYRRFGRELAELAPALAEHGARLHYHNHWFELDQQDGRTGLDLLAEAAGPEVGLELDLAWLRAAGEDPARWLERVPSERLTLAHLKDVRLEDGRQVSLPVGEGLLDWAPVLTAYRDAGVVWGIVEDDEPPGDPFDSLAVSLRALHDAGAA